MMPAPAITSRRHFLRAAGVSVALPFLPSLYWRAFGQATVKPSPQRFAFIYTPNGYHQKALLPTKLAAGLNPVTVGSMHDLMGD